MRISMRGGVAAWIAALVLLAGARPAAAWEEKGHTLVNRLAAEAMPEETPAFFRAAAARLAYLGPEPDRWKADGGPQLRAVNGPDHYMNMEPLRATELPGDRYAFLAMAREKGLKGEGIGFLPYRIAEMAQTLQSGWRDWRAAEDGSPERRYIEQNILYSAGVLGHYVADAANPHHATVHYNGWDTEFSPNPEGFTTSEAEGKRRPNGFHHRFEGAFVDAAITAAGVRPLMAKVKPVDRVFDESVAFVTASNTLVERLYRLEKRGAFDTSGEIDAEGLRFTQERLAAGASFLRDLWASAARDTAPAGPGGMTTTDGAPGAPSRNPTEE